MHQDVWTLNTRHTGTRAPDTRVHVYFNYTHFNTFSIKTHTIVFLNTREIETPNLDVVYALEKN